MGLTAEINITGNAAFMKKLQGLSDLADLGDFREALGKIGDSMTSYYEGQAFASQGGVYGTPWAKLSPSTQAFKSKHYRQYAAVPLIETGSMRSSFTSKASTRQLTISNSAPYFVYHQSSAPRGSSLPRRQMMGINTDIKAVIKTILTADVAAKLAVL